MAGRLAGPSGTAENPLSAVLPGLPRETNMAVYDNHWSCNGSTSQLPYCIIKSISPRVATNTTRFVIAGQSRYAHLDQLPCRPRTSIEGRFIRTIVEWNKWPEWESRDQTSQLELSSQLTLNSEMLRRFARIFRFGSSFRSPTNLRVEGHHDPLPVDVTKSDLGKKESRERSIESCSPWRLARITDSSNQLEIRRDWLLSRGNPGNVLITDASGFLCIFLCIYHFHNQVEIGNCVCVDGVCVNFEYVLNLISIETSAASMHWLIRGIYLHPLACAFIAINRNGFQYHQ